MYLRNVNCYSCGCAYDRIQLAPNAIENIPIPVSLYPYPLYPYTPIPISFYLSVYPYTLYHYTLTTLYLIPYILIPLYPYTPIPYTLPTPSGPSNLRVETNHWSPIPQVVSPQSSGNLSHSMIQKNS